MWYDWAYVHFEEVINGVGVESLYPAKILGLIKSMHGEAFTLV
jgi:hypothetical protein